MQQRHVTIVSWNVNGIRAAEKKGWLDWLRNSNADIVALQETKAHPEQVGAALREPPGYCAEWCAAERKGYSGVATFARVPPLSVSRGLGDPRFDADGRVLVTTFEEFVLYNVYFPSGSSGPNRVTYKLDFYKRFLEVIGPRLAAGERIVIAGDVNTAYSEIDLARPRENRRVSGFLPEEREALGQFFAAGLIDTFRYVRPTEAKYSWWTQRVNARERNIGWRLDYIFVSPNLQECIVDADIHNEVLGSDHCPVSLTLALPKI